MTHLAHRIHENSRSAYEAEETKLSARAQAVLAWILKHGPHTDREVMSGMGFTDMNSVRPRISELIDAGKLMEVCSRRCPVTNKSVRVVDVRGQRGLW
jgi:predicted HTH transcriptional regulator